ncbi:MAG: efflux RND transporter periplasmic adaptor subunit [Planctomycetia bacterium]|nr:efflux RND transporter periplasmic adaptor subunit [Planctomycetia bacterium]
MKRESGDRPSCREERGFPYSPRIEWLGIWLILTVIGCGGPRGVMTGPSIPTAVSVSEVKRSKNTDYEDFTGRTEPKESVEVKARVTGYLMKVTFEEGKLVKEGDVLYQLDDRTYKAELAKAEGEVNRYEALLDRLKADLNRARRMRVGDAISREEYDKTSGNVAEATGAIESAKAAVARTKLDVDFTSIKAPINGRISRTLVTVGNLVTADQTKLTTIVSIDPMYATFDVDERTVLRIQKLIKDGKFQTPREAKVPVLLGTQAEKGHPHKGFINFVDNRIDPSTGTLRVRGEWSNPDGDLTPGLFVRLRLPIGDSREVLMVADSALGTDQGIRYVFVVGPNNKVEQRTVTVGALRDGMRVVESGLKEGEKIITRGLQRVREGSVVEPTLIPMPGLDTK